MEHKQVLNFPQYFKIQSILQRRQKAISWSKGLKIPILTSVSNFVLKEQLGLCNLMEGIKGNIYKKSF